MINSVSLHTGYCDLSLELIARKRERNYTEQGKWYGYKVSAQVGARTCDPAPDTGPKPN